MDRAVQLLCAAWNRRPERCRLNNFTTPGPKIQERWAKNLILVPKTASPSVDLMIPEAMRLQNLIALKVMIPLGWTVISFLIPPERIGEWNATSLSCNTTNGRIQETAATKGSIQPLRLTKMGNNQNPARRTRTFMGCWSKDYSEVLSFARHAKAALWRIKCPGIDLC